MKVLKKALIPLLAIITMLVSCNGFRLTPATGQDAGPTDTEDPAVVPVTALTDTPSPLPPLTPTAPSIQEAGQVISYYFVDAAAGVFPEGSVVIIPDAYILAPAPSAWKRSPDTATNLRVALIAVLIDERNGWESKNLEIVEIAFDDGHATVALQGEYFGVGDVTLIAARMQILLTLFAEPSVQTATVKLNDDTIGNLGVSNSSDAKPVDYVFTRAEIEDFMNENAYILP